jgi:hypothetical protein
MAWPRLLSLVPDALPFRRVPFRQKCWILIVIKIHGMYFITQDFGAHENSMTGAGHMVIKAALISLFLMAAAYAQPFRSEYTDFSNCEWVSEGENGGDGAQECKGIDEYYIYEYYSTSATIRKIYSRTNQDFEICFMPEAVQEDVYRVDGYGNKIEWRFYGKEPIAVIYRVFVKSDTEDVNTRKEYLLIRGLYRYSNIEDEVDVKSIKNPNARARKLVDSLYTEYYLKGETPKDPL